MLARAQDRIIEFNGKHIQGYSYMFEDVQHYTTIEELLVLQLANDKDNWSKQVNTIYPTKPTPKPYPQHTLNLTSEDWAKHMLET